MDYFVNTAPVQWQDAHVNRSFFTEWDYPRQPGSQHTVCWDPGWRGWVRYMHLSAQTVLTLAPLSLQSSPSSSSPLSWSSPSSEFSAVTSSQTEVKSSGEGMLGLLFPLTFVFDRTRAPYAARGHHPANDCDLSRVCQSPYGFSLSKPSADHTKLGPGQ